jgi:hypothetical protein
MSKKKKPLFARQYADGDWVRAPISEGSAEWGVLLFRDREVAEQLQASGPVVLVTRPIAGEKHAVVVLGDLCRPMPMAEAFK